MSTESESLINEDANESLPTPTPTLPPVTVSSSDPTCNRYDKTNDDQHKSAVAAAMPQASSSPLPSSSSSIQAQHEAKKFLLKHKEKLTMNQYWYSLPTIAAMVTECERESKRACFLSTPSIFFSLNHKKLQENSKVFDYDEMWSKHPGFVKYDYKKADEIPKDLYHSFDFIVIDPPFITAEVWAEYAKAAKMLLVQGTEEIEIDTSLANSYHSSLLRSYEAALASLKGEVNGTSFAGNIASMLSTAIGSLNFGSTSSIGSMSSLPPLPPSPRPSFNDSNKSIVTVPKGKLLLSTIPEHEGYLYALLGCYQPKFRPSIPNLIYQYSLYINYPSQPLQELNPEIDSPEEMGANSKFTSKKKSTITF